MVQINAIAAKPSAQELNQVTRWILTKEEHADKIMRSTSDYLLAQRVKPTAFKNHSEFVEALVLHHTLLQAAMKTKQSVDIATCDALVHAIDHIAPIYGSK